ncbi:MAG: glycine zipper domain-containing protein [Flavisolibacter sp.]
MPESRKRPGHHEYKKPSDIPASQRTKGRIVWAILFGVFGLLIGFFASGSTIALIVGTLIGAAIGYALGLKMEKDAKA